MMLRSAPVPASLTVSTTHSSFSRTLRTHCTASLFASGLVLMISALKQFVTFANEPSLTTSTLPARPTGSRTA